MVEFEWEVTRPGDECADDFAFELGVGDGGDGGVGFGEEILD